MKVLKLFLFVSLMFYAVDMSSQSVYVTNTGAKYHKSTCHHLKSSKNEIAFEKALKLSYTSCSVCKPNNKGNSLDVMSTNAKLIVSPAASKSTSTTQCTGKTKAGARCKRMTKSDHGRCYQH